jgi:hypothetical protein
MPLRDFVCTSCKKEQERFFQPTKLKVSIDNFRETFHEETAPAYPPCEACGRTLTVLPLSQPTRTFVGAVFPFTTNHIDPQGKPMTIESMGHLRSIEKQYGVVLSAFSKNNIRDVDPIQDVPRYRGWDQDFRR